MPVEVQASVLDKACGGKVKEFSIKGRGEGNKQSAGHRAADSRQGDKQDSVLPHHKGG